MQTRMMSAFLMISSCFLLSSCASTLNSQQAVEGLLPPSIPFNNFQRVELKRTETVSSLADHAANIAAENKLDFELNKSLSGVFSNLTQLSENQGFSNSPAERTLQIEPHITDIRFIGTAARLWVGGFAGNSHIHVQVNYRDSQSGAIIADPSFRREASGTKGGWSVGATDRAMIDTIARDVAAYTENQR